jgi:hypothetical protein
MGSGGIAGPFLNSVRGQLNGLITPVHTPWQTWIGAWLSLTALMDIVEKNRTSIPRPSRLCLVGVQTELHRFRKYSLWKIRNHSHKPIGHTFPCTIGLVYVIVETNSTARTTIKFVLPVEPVSRKLAFHAWATNACDQNR